ncbi:MAG TPA: hypothetical protein VIK37_01325 [Candidatus Saccharimonadales bacterium]
MVKLLILILIGLALTFFGYRAFLSGDSPVNLPGYDSTSPTDAIQGSKDAVQQSQGVQDKLNNSAQDQLSQ